MSNPFHVEGIERLLNALGRPHLPGVRCAVDAEIHRAAKH